MIPILFGINIFLGGPLAEDVGWRGYIQGKFQERTSALNASLLIGVVWAIWHVPFFLIPQAAGVVGHMPFIWFAPLTTAWAVLFA